MIEIVLEISEGQDHEPIALFQVFGVQDSTGEVSYDSIQVCCLVIFDCVEVDESSWYRGSD